MPTLKQVQNFIYRESEPRHGPFTDADFKRHCRENFDDFFGDVESDDNAHINYWHFNGPDDFCMLWTSKKLLTKQLSSTFLQVRQAAKRE